MERVLEYIGNASREILNILELKIFFFKIEIYFLSQKKFIAASLGVQED